jgi:hypothetical protein
MTRNRSRIQAAALAITLLLPVGHAFAKQPRHHSKAKGAIVGAVAGGAVAGKKGAVAGAAIGAARQHHKNKKQRT